MGQFKYNIFINATAIQPGGGHTILLQFLKAYTEHPLPDTRVFVFNSIGLKDYLSPEIISVEMPIFNFLQRIYWDSAGMKQWASKNNIRPDLLLSFQNTGVRFPGIPQIIYLQQSIPFTKHQWNPFKKGQRNLWRYKNIYSFFIGLYLFKYTHVVVQTKWMKQAFLKKFNTHNPEKVHVFSPEIDIVDVNEIHVEDFDAIEPSTFNFFYPATSFIYKNHIEIIKAFAAIKKENKLGNIRCYFTISFDELSKEAQQLIIINELYSNFVFLGALSLRQVYYYYTSLDALIFPSYIETIGLPLIESAGCGLPILVADEPYSREVLKSYDNVRYAKTKDTDDWKNKIYEVLELKKTYPQKIRISEEGWQNMLQLTEFLIKT
ncbi:glycosyltransferase family 4 protein [Taibaiella lutea]|uniref:Glycosyltransferase family 4 protein n=1 Tax=Taibaiella lutea TaxID=2608001 RepID=A0A5M6CFE9_9BACT|nr:glycosyltransferase [Taibaiella lutea]KAA5533777.1 glycosyltransferase family 4 protein [Taibaiella lutea]